MELTIKTIEVAIMNQAPDEWHTHILCLGEGASAVLAGCESSPSVHVYLVGERHHLVALEKESKPARFEDNSMLFTVIDAGEPELDGWLERFERAFNAMPDVFIVMKASEANLSVREAHWSGRRTSMDYTSCWHFAAHGFKQNVFTEFVLQIAEPPLCLKNNLISVELADYRCALDGEGLIHVAKSVGHGCEQAQKTAKVIVKQLESAGATLEKALGIVLIVETGAGCKRAISLFDDIAHYVKLRIKEDVTLIVSAPLSQTLPADKYNVYLAVRE